MIVCTASPMIVQRLVKHLAFGASEFAAHLCDEKEGNRNRMQVLIGMESLVTTNKHGDKPCPASNKVHHHRPIRRGHDSQTQQRQHKRYTRASEEKGGWIPNEAATQSTSTLGAATQSTSTLAATQSTSTLGAAGQQQRARERICFRRRLHIRFRLKIMGGNSGIKVNSNRRLLAGPN